MDKSRGSTDGHVKGEEKMAKEKMHSRNRLLRILKFLGKGLLGLILLLLLFLLFIHIPAVQKQVAHKLSTFLSSKTEGMINIDQLEFSIWGNLAIKGAEIRDRNDTKILSFDELSVKTNLLDVLGGQYLIGEIFIKGADGYLSQQKGELNIQFILDAFTSDKPAVASSKTTTIQFRKITLEECKFQFISDVNAPMKIDAVVGKFTTEDAILSLNPNQINIGKVGLHEASVMILTETDTDLQPVDEVTIDVQTGVFSIPQFDPGIDLKIDQLEVDGTAFSFHHDKVEITPKFDPNHLSLKEIQIKLANILIREDTLASDLNSLSAQMPGFNLSRASGQVRMNHNRVEITGLSINTGTSDLSSNLEFSFDSPSIGGNADPSVKTATSLHIHPADISYFLSDDILNYFDQWQSLRITLTGDYVHGKGRLETLALETSESKIYTAGTLHHIWDPEKLAWEDLLVQVTLGQDLKNTFAPFTGEMRIPPDLNLKMVSTGNLHDMIVDGKVNTTWGNLEAKGRIRPSASITSLDMHLTGKNVKGAEWIDLPWLGNVNMTLDAKGTIGDRQDLNFKGLVRSIGLMDQQINDITLEGRLLQDSVSLIASIADPEYRMDMNGGISFGDSLLVDTDVQLNEFSLGKLLKRDTMLSISGNLSMQASIGDSSIAGNVESIPLMIKNRFGTYNTDTLTFKALISPQASMIDYYADGDRGNLTSNFDLRDLLAVLESKTKEILHDQGVMPLPKANRSLRFEFALHNPVPLRLMGMAVDEFGGVSISGDIDEQKDLYALQASSGVVKANGISLDSVQLNFEANGNDARGKVEVMDLEFDQYDLGNLNWDINSSRDTLVSDFLLSGDSISLFGLRALILLKDTAVIVYPDRVVALDKDYTVDQQARVLIREGNIDLDHFRIAYDDMKLNLQGDLNDFEADFENLDLRTLNVILSPDSNVIKHGTLTGKVTYTERKTLNVDARIDSLVIHESIPLGITLTAKSEEKRVPFQFLLSSENNTVDVQGKYFLDSENIEALLKLDVSNLELFSFLFAGVLDEMKGKVIGEASIAGPVNSPDVNGQLQFLDVGITTSDPKFSFYIKDDMIRFDGEKVSMDHFVLYDRQDHPLTITGYMSSKDFKAFSYDLKVKTDRYTLLDVPVKSKDQLKGILVVAADIGISGDEKDTYINAIISIKDTTSLIYTYAEEDVDLLKTEGIIEFVDPGVLLDSAAMGQPVSFYDSLMSSLPEFKLKSTFVVEDSVRIKLVTNAQSGDYLEAVGGAKFDVESNRTGNLLLSGNYTIHQGLYRVSFYDLVKKNFMMVPKSSVRWSGSPETGEIDVAAVHTVTSNSIGLVGHEVGENEKSIYKKALDYIIGINIKGTLVKPVVSFSLDLSKQDRASYPVLANKLDRLRSPEFQTELNKQVFGLLVLGGFLPEASGSEVNSNQVATTALYNSVNSILASQLNRFAGQYIKGVNIDVGIQSYADYSTPGGKTQTSMDFRVSKSVFNERLSFEVGGDFDIHTDQSGANTGNNYRGDVAIIYDLTGNGDKQLKLFNNETYDIIYQEIRNTGISLVFIREFDKGEKRNKKGE